MPRGGKQPGAGRKRLLDNARTISLTLDNDVYRRIPGNKRAFIRRAVDLALAAVVDRKAMSIRFDEVIDYDELLVGYTTQEIGYDGDTDVPGGTRQIGSVIDEVAVYTADGVEITDYLSAEYMDKLCLYIEGRLEG